MSIKKRFYLLAALLSILTPGLGQIYKGQHKKGIIFLSFIILFPIIFLPILFDNFYGYIFCLLIYFGYYLYIIGDAASPLKSEFKAYWYNKWYIYLILFFVISLSQSFILDLARENIYAAYRIPTSSHSPTLVIGDQIIVDSNIYRNKAVSRFDNVVFKQEDDPNTEKDETSTTSVKRVIGLPGEKLEIKDAKVYIDDEPIKEPFAVWLDGGSESFGPYYIPENRYFLLGDNRDRSKDSRYYYQPFIPKQNIKGKVLYVYLNLQKPSRIGLQIR